MFLRSFFGKWPNIVEGKAETGFEPAPSRGSWHSVVQAVVRAKDSCTCSVIARIKMTPKRGWERLISFCLETPVLLRGREIPLLKQKSLSIALGVEFVEI
jgi:hypothetical protein